jgi:hypothetical protein
VLFHDPPRILDRHLVTRERSHSRAICDVQILKRRAFECRVSGDDQRHHWKIRTARLARFLMQQRSANKVMPHRRGAHAI